MPLFPALNLASMTSGIDLFKGTTLSPASYGNLLIELATRNTKTGISFHGGGSLYPAGEATVARNTLVTDRGWTVTDGGAQTISISPTSGTHNGGTSVTITGTNLTGTSSVTFGGSAASAVSVVDANTVTCVTPASDKGMLADVRLTTLAGAVTGVGVYSYTDTQLITFATIVSSSSGTTILAATASSGLPVVFSVLSGPASLSGNTLTINGPGTITIAADQAGNASYLPAPQITQTVITSQPTVVLSSTATVVTAGGPVTMNVVFSEAVTGLDPTGCTVTQGTINTITGSGMNWTITLTAGTTVGAQLGLIVNAAVVQNTWGIRNLASNNLTLPIVAAPTSSSSKKCGLGGGLGLVGMGLLLVSLHLMVRISSKH